MDQLALPSLPQSLTTSLPTMSNARTEAQMRETAEEFEAGFLGIMLNTMMAGVGDDPVLGRSSGSDTWRGMLTEEYAKTISSRGGIGVADQIYREMIRMQEAAQ